MFDEKTDQEKKLELEKKIKAAEKVKADIAYANSVMLLGIKKMKIDPEQWDNANLD